MNSRTSARIKEILRTLRKYDPERVILFGSVARGDADPYSDIDLVVIKNTRQKFMDRLERVYDFVRPDFGLDVLVYTPSEFAKMQAENNPFLEQVTQEGILVYDRARGFVGRRMRSAQTFKGIRKMGAEKEGQRWLEQAKSDLELTKWNEQGGFHSAACFWAQQTAERALKAFLYFRGKRRIMGQSVAELAKACAKLDVDFRPLVNEVAKLDRYYIPTRYPNGLPGGVPAQSYQADEAQAAIQLAEKTVNLVASKIPEPHEE